MSSEDLSSLGARAADDRSLADRLARVFHVVFAGVAVIALITFGVFAVVEFGFRPDVRRQVDGANAVREAQLAMIDQETGLRGYLLTRQDTFLQPYRDGLRALRQANDDATRLLGGDGSAARALLGMRLAQQAWTDRWAMPARAAAVAAPGTPALDEFIAAGKVLFDAYRAKTALVLSAVDKKRDTALDTEGTVLRVGVVLDLAVLVLISILATRQFRRLRGSVMGPVQEMVDTVARIGAGDFDVRSPRGAPAELARIGDGLVRAAGALRESQARDDARQSELARQSEKLARILNMSREIAGSLNLRYVLEAVSTSAASVSGHGCIRIWILDEKAGVLRQAHRSDGAPGGATAQLGDGLAGEAAKYGRTVTETATGSYQSSSDGTTPLVRVALPMVVGARIVGVLDCEHADAVPLPPDDLDALETLASHAATALEAARLHGETTQLSQTDALTQLLNRRRLDDDLAAECYRSQRYGRPLALIMLDVDHFKRFNDTHGHQRGDEVLEELGKVLTGVIRTSDTAYRYGGEEFTVLCREATQAGAAELAERLRARLEQRLAHDGITASFGVAAAPDDGKEPAELVAAADRALYAAKRQGRNTVVVATRSAFDEASEAGDTQS